MRLYEIKSLVKLANDLDGRGLYGEADLLDGVILKLAQEGGGELHIYDFDGTLFRSPHEPSSWEKDWWSDPASLLPPCVPENPGDEWWIGETVEAAKRSISDANVFSIMMTGRKQASAFSYRVAELLSQAGLDFDRVHLSVGEGDVLGEKISKALKYLSDYPFVDTVRIWDDRPSHLSKFKKVLEDRGYTVYTTHVKARSMDPLCGDNPERSAVVPKKVSYVGIFLDSSSKATLVDNFTIKHNKIGNDHITLSMKLTPELEGMIGQRVEARVVGYSEDDKGQAVAVELPSDIPYLVGSIPHVTLSHSSDVQPKYSKDLLEKGFESLSGPTISGYIDTYPRSLIQKSASRNFKRIS